MVTLEQVRDELRADVELIPERLRVWWLDYLDQQFDRYRDYLVYVDGRGERILEVGTVPGHFTVLLRRLGHDVTGVDIDPSRAERLWEKYGVRVERADVEQEPLPFPDEAFELVYFCEILEHLRINPIFALRECARVLAPGGRIVVVLPAITPLHRLLFLRGKPYLADIVDEYAKLDWLGHMGHVRLYEQRQVARLLDHAGLTVDRIERKGPMLYGAGVVRALLKLYPRRERLRSQLYVVGSKR